MKPYTLLSIMSIMQSKFAPLQPQYPMHLIYTFLLKILSFHNFWKCEVQHSWDLKQLIKVVSIGHVPYFTLNRIYTFICH